VYLLYLSIPLVFLLVSFSLLFHLHDSLPNVTNYIDLQCYIVNRKHRLYTLYELLDFLRRLIQLEQERTADD